MGIEDDVLYMLAVADYRLGIRSESVLRRIESRKRKRTGNRLVFDRDARTITLDGKPFRNLDPTAFEILAAIKEGDGCPVSKLEKKPRLRGKNICRELKKLPIELRKIIQSDTGTGRWISLPECH
jgi:hypothetical protein